MEDRSDNADGSSLWRRSRADALALASFLIAFLAIFAYRARNDTWLAEYDILSYFIPWYGHLGDRLRAFDVPGWMPWLSSGSPVAGDPSGGWWYLPVMVAFSLFDVTTAFKAMILIQTIIGGGAVYAFARLLGLRPIAALMSTVAYVFGPFLASQFTYGTVAGQVSAWLPVALVGVECSLGSRRVLARLSWWAVAGVAISQIAVSWPGQGLYNALLVIAGWVAYRSLVWPVRSGRSVPGRLVDALTAGPAVLLFGLLLGAAGLLPRLNISSVSNIPNGDYSGVAGGDYLVEPHSLASLLRDTFQDDARFRPVAIAAPVAVLALLAVVIGRGRYGVPYFAALTIIVGIMSLDETPLHHVLYLLPKFEDLHTHSPRRLPWVCFIAPAMLSGAGVEALLRWRPRRRWVLLLLGIPLVALGGVTVVLHRDGEWIGWWPVMTAAITTALAGAIVTAWRVRGIPFPPHLAVGAMMVLTVAYASGRHEIVGPPDMDWSPADLRACLATYVSRRDPGGAGEFLQREQAAGEPFRYVSYAGRDPASDDPSYNFRRCDQDVLAALAGGRAVHLELETVQGYNPIHLGVYSEYIDVMNGGRQDYHWVDPYPAVLGSSPLLDMLNVRFIVVALEGPEGPYDTRWIAEGKDQVFRNDQVVVYENLSAFPRAWIVHEVRPNQDGVGLRQLARGDVDGREVAFIDGPMPDVEVAHEGDGAGESVEITGRSEDSITAVIHAESSGLVVFSEVFEDGWRAYVDGEEVGILRTNHALRGVPVPAGEHTIELRYEPRSLEIGLWVSGATGIAVLAIWIAAIRQWRIDAKGEPDDFGAGLHLADGERRMHGEDDE